MKCPEYCEKFCEFLLTALVTKPQCCWWCGRGEGATQSFLGPPLLDLLWWNKRSKVISLVTFDSSYIGSPPRGAASGMSRCHFFGWLLMCLLSFHHMQLGWNFNMLVSWGSKLARGIDHLWSWARFMATQILVINFPIRASWQKLWPKF